MLIKALSTIKHDGIVHEVGDVFEVESDEMANRLFSFGVAESAEEVAEETKAVTLADLKAEATELGIEFANNIKKDKLVSLIEAKKLELTSDNESEGEGAN